MGIKSSNILKQCRTAWCRLCENRYILFLTWAAAVAIFAWQLLEVRTSLLGTEGSLIAMWVKMLVDGVLIMLPFWLLGARWRWTILLPVWLMGLLLWANVLYFRMFGLLIPFSAFGFTDNFDSLLFGSVKALWRSSDVFPYFAAPALLTAFVIWKRKALRRASLPGRMRWAAAASSLAAFLLMQAYYFYASRSYWQQEDCDISLTELLAANYLRPIASSYELRYLGWPVYLAKGGLLYIFSDGVLKELSQEQTELIEDYLDRRQAVESVAEDSVFAANRNKNLILIVVESFNANAVGRRINGVPVTPTIDSLLRSDGTISALRVLTQAKDGGSSDGQMIYDTGLLPIASGSACMNFAGHTFPSLAKELTGHKSFEVIYERPQAWNHFNTTKTFGFGELYSISAMNDSASGGEETGGDRAVLEYGLQQIEARRETPLLAKITTVSMHLPFSEPDARRIPEFEADGSLSKVARNYYTTVRYFDEQLGHFLEGLEQAGLLEKSIVVIVADHSCYVDGDKYQDERERPDFIPFIAVGTGVTRDFPEIVGQIDIYPTLLRIMGRLGDASWRGLGTDLFGNSGPYGAVNKFGDLVTDETTADFTTPEYGHMRDAWTVSDLLIRSDWFGKRR